MKRLHWFTLMGLSGVSFAALLAAQVVRGQPETKEPLAAPFVVPQPGIDLPRPDEVSGERKSLEPGMMPVLQAPADQKPASEFAAPGSFVVQTGSTDLPAPRVGPGDLPAATPMAPPLFKGNGVTLPPAVMPGQPQPNALVALDVQPGKQQPAVTIEWVAPATARINQPIACQIVVRNTSTTSAQNVMVRHRLGQGVVCKTSEPAATREVGELLWQLGNLAPGQTRRIDLTLVSSTRATFHFPATVTFTGVSAHRVHVQEPKLTIKMRGPDKAIVGESVTLLVAISNPGDGLAELVKVKAVLPDGFEHPRGKVLEFDVGNLAPAEIRTMQIPCLAKGSGMQKCAILASGDGGLTAVDSTQIDVLMPKLDVVLTGPKLRYLDRPAVYVLKVTNPGSAAATNIQVQELIPAGFKFQQANHGGQFQDSTRFVSWTLGELPPGKSMALAVDLVPIETGEHRLIAHAKAARGLKTQAEARTLVEALSSLSIEASHVDDPIEVGAETAYEIRVANTGTKTETNIEIVCTIPEQLEFRGAKCSTALRYRQEGRELIFEPLARLAPRADMIYRIQVKGIAPGDVRFRTRVRADGLKEPVVREESMKIYRDDMPIRSTTAVPVLPTKAIEPEREAPAPSPVLPAPRPFSAPPISQSPAPLNFPVTPVIPAPRGSLPAPLIPPDLPVAPPANFNP